MDRIITDEYGPLNLQQLVGPTAARAILNYRIAQKLEETLGSEITKRVNEVYNAELADEKKILGEYNELKKEFEKWKKMHLRKDWIISK